MKYILIILIFFISSCQIIKDDIEISKKKISRGDKNIPTENNNQPSKQKPGDKNPSKEEVVKYLGGFDENGNDEVLEYYQSIENLDRYEKVSRISKDIGDMLKNSKINQQDSIELVFFQGNEYIYKLTNLNFEIFNQALLSLANENQNPQNNNTPQARMSRSSIDIYNNDSFEYVNSLFRQLSLKGVKAEFNQKFASFNQAYQRCALVSFDHSYGYNPIGAYFPKPSTEKVIDCEIYVRNISYEYDFKKAENVEYENEDIQNIFMIDDKNKILSKSIYNFFIKQKYYKGDEFKINHNNLCIYNSWYPKNDWLRHFVRYNMPVLNPDGGVFALIEMAAKKFNDPADNLKYGNDAFEYHKRYRENLAHYAEKAKLQIKTCDMDIVIAANSTQAHNIIQYSWSDFVLNETVVGLIGPHRVPDWAFYTPFQKYSFPSYTPNEYDRIISESPEMTLSREKVNINDSVNYNNIKYDNISIEDAIKNFDKNRFTVDYNDILDITITNQDHNSFKEIEMNAFFDECIKGKYYPDHLDDIYMYGKLPTYECEIQERSFGVKKYKAYIAKEYLMKGIFTFQNPEEIFKNCFTEEKIDPINSCILYTFNKNNNTGLTKNDILDYLYNTNTEIFTKDNIQISIDDLKNKIRDIIVLKDTPKDSLIYYSKYSITEDRLNHFDDKDSYQVQSYVVYITASLLETVKNLNNTTKLIVNAMSI